MRKIIWTIALSIIAFYAAAHLAGQTDTYAVPGQSRAIQTVVGHHPPGGTTPGQSRPGVD
ncbi:MAG TPA: hypothetical protein VGO91_07695 [Pyrinomonadaceae bacterium]|jgi:hypothetical protein|nr:hypothetical protein [Pyrinomonadaceae bacterium]